MVIPESVLGEVQQMTGTQSDHIMDTIYQYFKHPITLDKTDEITTESERLVNQYTECRHPHSLILATAKLTGSALVSFDRELLETAKQEGIQAFLPRNFVRWWQGENASMKLLVLEKNELVLEIYKKIFQEKEYDAYYAKNESEFFEKFYKKYDYVVLENLNVDSLEQKILEIKPEQKILSLAKFMNSNYSPELNEIKELIEKPFAILTMIGSLELECSVFTRN